MDKHSHTYTCAHAPMHARVHVSKCTTYFAALPIFSEAEMPSRLTRFVRSATLPMMMSERRTITRTP